MDAPLNQLPCGVVLIDEAGNIMTINATAEQHLAYATGELTGRPFSKLLTPAGQMLYQSHIYPLISLHGRIDEAVLTLVTQTDTRILVLFNAIRRFQDGQWVIYGVYLPLNQRHSYEAELIQARQSADQARLAAEESESRYRTLAADLEARVVERTNELETANADLHRLNMDLTRSNDNLQQFAYVASHDLQEPLRKIQSFSSILEQQYGAELGDLGKDMIQRMSKAGSRMSALIRALLIYSRVATRQQSFGLVSLDRIVADVLTTLDLTIAERAAQVDIARLPMVNGDETQLNQLFQNLLSNAIKFTPIGVKPRIRVDCTRQQRSDLPAGVVPSSNAAFFYQIKVSDEGVGFDTKYLDRIFQVFQRLHGRNEFPGTGIGLAICQRVVENHGGSITASSKLGEGATFSVYLPA